jgi:uncharacterized protein YdhG (YjbR/CyaY superfamily)
MRIEANDVPGYLAHVPETRRPALQGIRRLCNEILTGYEECIEYGMPAYRRRGAVEVAFASQRNYVSLYILKTEVMNEFRDSLAKYNPGKGCIRFPIPAKIDFDLVARLLKRTAQSTSSAC